MICSAILGLGLKGHALDAACLQTLSIIMDMFKMQRFLDSWLGAGGIFHQARHFVSFWNACVPLQRALSVNIAHIHTSRNFMPSVPLSKATRLRTGGTAWYAVPCNTFIFMSLG